MNTQAYFEDLRKQVDSVYKMAGEARAGGLDSVDEVEIPLAMSMAEKVVGLISTIYPQMKNSGISKRILELEVEYGKLDPTIVFKIAEEVAYQKFCSFDNLIDAIDAGIRVGFAYATLAVVSSPIEGFTGLKIKKTRDNRDYLEASFSGPIRSAGTTASCLVLMLIDYLRELFGFAKYDPVDDEIKRTYAELSHFHERITNLQYMPTEEEALFLARNLPIQISGEPSEKIEVPNYKNLPRVSTNFLRSGFCLILAEGLAQKAAKGFRLLNNAKKNGIKSTGFDWLKEYVELHEKHSIKADNEGDIPVYIKDIVAGRPVFGHPKKSGGFRFRYGRSRISGFSATSLHPATMAITDNFIATGTQLKIERPTKGCAVTPCDSIDGPIIKLFNGSVKKIKTKKEAEKFYKDTEEIIYLGDILFPFSDILNRNSGLIKPGYVEEWWSLDLREKDPNFEIDYFNVDFEKAIELSRQYQIPLHPNYIFYWTQISREEFDGLIYWLNHSRVNGKIILPYNKAEQIKFAVGKRALELLGIAHEISIENAVLNKEDSKALLLNLGVDYKITGCNENIFLKEFLDQKKFSEFNSYMGVLEIVNSVSCFVVKDKAGEFIGARMGRPEKAKLRKLTGSPNVLFPVSKEGGKFRSIQTACESGKIRSTFPIYFCEKCNKETIYPGCEVCRSKTKKRYFYRSNNEKLPDDSKDGLKGVPYFTQNLDINYYFDKAMKKLGLEKNDVPILIKGIRGTSSKNHFTENLAKGILRAKYGLQVNKDGTIRMDATELPLVCFKPKEISVSIEKLLELGYSEDIYGKSLENKDQILELMPHDVILPCCRNSLDEKADDVFFKVSKFIDEELEKFYGLKSFYNLQSKEDLIGQLGVCMAPHNCAGVVCRFIGFSNTQGLFASPYMHAAVRRDCLSYNNYVSVKKNGVWRVEKIGKIVEENNPDKKIDFYGTLKKEMKNTFTYSNPGIGEIKELTKHSPQKLFRVYTEDGRCLELTGSHMVYLKGKKEKAVQEIKIGDQLIINYKRDIEEKDFKEINLPEIFADKENVMLRNLRTYLTKFENLKKYKNFYQRDRFPIILVKEILEKNGKKLSDLPAGVKIAIRRDNVAIPIKIPFSEELCEIIGLYIAEGYMRGVKSEKNKKGLYQVYIASQDRELKKRIKKVMKKYFELVPTENKEDRVTYSSRILYELFHDYFKLGDLAKNKRIPSLFLDLKRTKIAALLRGYYEGDGSVSLSDNRVQCDSVSEGLKNDLSFVLSRFGIYTKFYEYEKEPGPKVRDFYLRKERKIPKFKITKITIPSNFVKKFEEIGFISKRKRKILKELCRKIPRGMRIDFDEQYIYPKVTLIEEREEAESYCFNVLGKHNFFANDILVHNCDGDETSVMLLGDVLLNFSREFLPAHRGGTQDAPLVLNAKIDAGEVDDQILDFEVLGKHELYPLELYRKAEKKLRSSEVIEVDTIKKILKLGGDPFKGMGFTHDTGNLNEGVSCSSYKLLATMQEKVQHQMELVEKLRSADTSDVARMIVERHFIRDMRGNLRGFSTQEFRCVKCNEIVRRPPLKGVCPFCRGKLIFTIHEGGIKKYLEPAMDLAARYNLSPYLKQNLELIKRYIESIFGKELEKQEALGKWF